MASTLTVVHKSKKTVKKLSLSALQRSKVWGFGLELIDVSHCSVFLIICNDIECLCRLLDSQYYWTSGVIARITVVIVTVDHVRGGSCW